jgi:YebC/PmpR family DNA-binding regulatory protein
MSGHSKWANIKRKKEANDKVKGSIFSKLSRLITLAVIEGGGIGDPDKNFKLRLAVDKARLANMPKDNIRRAIDRALGSNKDILKEIIYEAFAPGKVLLIIQATSDNSNRTLSEIRYVLERYGGKLGTQGSVMYLFRKCGTITFAKTEVSEEAVFEFSNRIEALDIDQDNENYFVVLPFENLGKIKEYLGNLQYKEAEIDYKPLTTIKVDSEEEARKILQLIDSLEALDDVQKVFSNFDIHEEILNRIGAQINSV